MKTKPQIEKIVTVKVPDYKPALAVVVIALAAMFTVGIVSKNKVIIKVPPDKVTVESVNILIDGHSYFSFRGSEATHATYCDKCANEKRK